MVRVPPKKPVKILTPKPLPQAQEESADQELIPVVPKETIVVAADVALKEKITVAPKATALRVNEKHVEVQTPVVVEPKAAEEAKANYRAGDRVQVLWSEETAIESAEVCACARLA